MPLRPWILCYNVIKVAPHVRVYVQNIGNSEIIKCHFVTLPVRVCLFMLNIINLRYAQFSESIYIYYLGILRLSIDSHGSSDVQC